MVWERSPLATEPITRATSVDGCTNSPIRLFTDSTHCAHPPDAHPRLARSLILPSFPTALLIRSNSMARRWLNLKMSFIVSTILPAMPVWSTGSRTEKSPSRNAMSVFNRVLISSRSVADSGFIGCLRESF